MPAHYVPSGKLLVHKSVLKMFDFFKTLSYERHDGTAEWSHSTCVLPGDYYMILCAISLTGEACQCALPVPAQMYHIM